MYGHVCETGGTREVLPPRPLKRFTFKDLPESQDRLFDWTKAFNVQLTTASNGFNKQSQRERRSARLCCALALLYVGLPRHLSFNQIKAEQTASRAM